TRMLDALPCVAPVARDVDAARRAAAEHRPGVHHDLPRTGEQDARILLVDREARASGVLVDEQHLLPRLAAVGGAIDAAVVLWTGRAAERADEDDVRVGRMNDDPLNA